MNMEINKELFENVLSGKLKGTFVLKCGIKILSDELSFNDNYDKEKYPYMLWKMSYTPEGYFHVGEWTEGLSIIDFIQDTDMKEKELIIEIPDNKVVDWEKSKKQNKIVLKDRQLIYEDVCDKLFKNKEVFYLKVDGEIVSAPCSDIKEAIYDKNNAVTKHQLKCILAKNQLANVALFLNNGWKPKKYDHVFAITYRGNFDNEPTIGEFYFGCGENLVVFKTQYSAQQAIEILGEETVKLALEPLGI